MFARDRAVAPAAYRTLGERVAEAPKLRHAQQLVDCEISFGDALSAGFHITASSLPYRIGDALEQHVTRDRRTTMDRAANAGRTFNYLRPRLERGELACLEASVGLSSFGQETKQRRGMPSS